ncbi:MAG: T9SS type A sorting domain-containing protein [Bacteroidales bacterium]|nr:T9SS type A sorting domain-containing protein [Bacteroidales bacterium]
MKNKSIIFFSALTALLLNSFHGSTQSVGLITDTILMGPFYGKEVYYDLSSGSDWAIDRKQWDIAFQTSRMSASILTNDASNNNALGVLGVELFTYENADTTGWSAVDTTGLSTWKLLVNSTTDWETGAFCQNQSGHPDYGWGKYNAVTHDVIGDSIYIIKLRDGSFKKLWIMRKYSSDNKYAFKYANLDGSNEQSIMLDCNPYATKNFVGFSLTTDQVVDFEPVESAGWDILFAKYMYTYPDGVLYPVTGVLSNYDIKVNRFQPVAPDFRIFDAAAMDSTRSPIGWEWKYLDPSFIYHVEDSLVHFILDKSGDIYRLVFKEFAGSSTGRVVFEKELISLASVSELTGISSSLAVYPNPASDYINLLLNPGSASSIILNLKTINGQSVWEKEMAVENRSLNKLLIPSGNLPNGIYIITMIVNGYSLTKKVIIQH